jgi:hypothetical protein
VWFKESKQLMFISYLPSKPTSRRKYAMLKSKLKCLVTKDNNNNPQEFYVNVQGYEAKMMQSLSLCLKKSNLVAVTFRPLTLLLLHCRSQALLLLIGITIMLLIVLERVTNNSTNFNNKSMVLKQKLINWKLSVSFVVVSMLYIY